MEGSLEGICNVFKANEQGFHVYIPFLTNMEQGLKILREYGGTFLSDYQRQLGDSMSLIGHLCSPRVRLVHYLEMFRDLTYCVQKQYLHGVDLVKVSISGVNISVSGGNISVSGVILVLVVLILVLVVLISVLVVLISVLVVLILESMCYITVSGIKC